MRAREGEAGNSNKPTAKEPVRLEGNPRSALVTSRRTCRWDRSPCLGDPRFILSPSLSRISRKRVCKMESRSLNIVRCIQLVQLLSRESSFDALASRGSKQASKQTKASSSRHDHRDVYNASPTRNQSSSRYFSSFPSPSSTSNLLYDAQPFFSIIIYL